jgi:hypothetical protein
LTFHRSGAAAAAAAAAVVVVVVVVAAAAAVAMPFVAFVSVVLAFDAAERPVVVSIADFALSSRSARAN